MAKEALVQLHSLLTKPGAAEADLPAGQEAMILRSLIKVTQDAATSLEAATSEDAAAEQAGGVHSELAEVYSLAEKRLQAVGFAAFCGENRDRYCLSFQAKLAL